MLKWRSVKRTIVVILILVLVLPPSSFAANELNHNDFERVIKGIQQQDKVQSDMLSSKEKRELIDQYSELRDSPGQERFSSAKLSADLESNVDLQRDFANFRRDYRKQQNGFQKASIEVDLEEVNDRGIIVKWKEGKTFDASIFNVESLKVPEFLKQHNIYLVRVLEIYNYDQKLQELKRESYNIYAEPDYLLESSYIPSDPEFDKQW